VATKNTTSSSSVMIPWLHFGGGDNLIFKSVHPSSKGAIAAACIVLAVIAMFERWLAATRSSLEAKWRQRTLSLISRRDDSAYLTSDDKEKASEVASDIQSVARTNSPLPRKTLRAMAPFIAAHDIPRGAIHAIQVSLGYTLMLAVMTFQAAYLISIIVGLGVGEVLFGRIGSSATHVH